MFLRSIVSCTSWKTIFIFFVSIAVVKWWKSGCDRSERCSSNSRTRKCWTSFSEHGSPRKCGKYSRMSTTAIFSSSRSVLLRNRMIEMCENALLLTIVLNMLQDSMRRFVRRSSNRTWSNSLDDARNKIEVTFSKQRNHRWRCDRCPPTSTKWKGTLFIRNSCSMMPFVALRACRISSFVGK